jgi:hypothetical protein
MTSKETAALRRLSKKLSALRATLNKDERALLDRMILGKEVQAHAGRKRAAEVQGHTIVRAGRKLAAAMGAMAATPAAQKTVSGGRKASRTISAAEVQGHSVMAVSTASTANRTALGPVQAASAASSANRAAAGPVQSASAATGAALLEFDATTGGYRPIGAAI